MCEKKFFFNNILENLENRHARMSYWTNTQEKKGKKKFFFLTFMCHFRNGKKHRMKKKKELEGTVVIMETAGFSSFFSYFFSPFFILGERLRKMSRNKSCFALCIL
ncbi:hypothetical protein ACKWTF_011752 [Chironomus riparius]